MATKLLIVQPYLNIKGGVERVILEIARHYDAPVYTLEYNKNGTFPEYKNVDVKTSGIPKKIEPQIKIQNIVVSSDLNANIDLFSLSKGVKEVDYEPEQFPGAIFRIKEPKAVIILFKNGKLICTGASNTKDIKIVLERAAKIISRYVIQS